MNRSEINNINRSIKYFELSFNPFVCWINSAVSFIIYLSWRFIIQKKYSLKPLLECYFHLFKSHHRNVLSPLFLLATERIIVSRLRDGIEPLFQLDGCETVSKAELNHLNKTGIVLKKPVLHRHGVVEKGVILLKSTERFRTFRRCVDIPALLADYTLVLEPSWSGHAKENILYFTKFAEHKIIVMASEPRDFMFLKRIELNLVPINLNSGDWVNPTVFRPLPGIEKRYDVVFIARPAIYKRHHVLFHAVRDMNDKSLQVAIVADPWPGNRRDVELLIDFYGIRHNVTYLEDLRPPEVNVILNRAKVNAVLSLQEGGNRCLFEGFFADVPGLALKCNVGIRKDHFNSQTGRLISEKDLATELMYFRDHWNTFSPRDWAERNITPELSTAKLNALVKELALNRGEPWTVDLVAKCNCPNPEYYPTENAGRDLPTMPKILRTYAKCGTIRHTVTAGV